jgi:hypothetical protein
MKKYLLYLILLFALRQPVFINAQVSSAVKTKLFTISAGEKPVYSECTISISSTGSNVSLVTADDNGKFYLYGKGLRKGPFDDAKSTEWHGDEDADEMNTSIYTDSSETNEDDLLSNTEDGKRIIKAGGKTYGPFRMISEFYPTKDGKMSAAVVTDDGMKFKLLTQSGTSIDLEGTPSYTSVSPSRNIVIIATTKEYNPAIDFQKVDVTKMTPEQMMKFSQELEEKQKNAPAPQSFLYFNNGKKLGPYPKDTFDGSNPAFCKTGGENWFMTVESKLYINGIEVADLGTTGISNDNIWISNDGKRYAINTYDFIKFSDGSTYNFPIMIKVSKKDEKTILITWVSLENEKDIVLYSKPL